MLCPETQIYFENLKPLFEKNFREDLSFHPYKLMFVHKLNDEIFENHKNQYPERLPFVVVTRLIFISLDL